MKFLPFFTNIPWWLAFILSPLTKESDTKTIYLDVEKEYFKLFISSRLHLTEKEKQQVLVLIKDEGELISNKDSNRITSFLLDLVGRTFKEDDKLPKKIPFWKSHLEHIRFHEKAASRQTCVIERMEEIMSCCNVLQKTVPKTKK